MRPRLCCGTGSHTRSLPTRQRPATRWGPKAPRRAPAASWEPATRAGVAALQEADGTRCRDGRGPSLRALPPQGQIWDRGLQVSTGQAWAQGAGARKQAVGRTWQGGLSGWCLRTPIQLL